MQTQCDQREEAAAYVLGELRGFALTDFMRHLLTCPVCTEEVELLESAAHAVPLLATQPAPRERPPVQADSNAAFLTPASERQRPFLRPIIGGGTAVSAGGKPRRGNRIPKPVMIGVAALALIAVITAILTRESNSIHYIQAQAGWSGGGAVVKIQGTQAELLVKDMPKPPAGKTYEIWVVDKNASKPAPTGSYIRLNSAGEAGVWLSLDVDDLIALAVYEEPLHGAHTTESGAVVVADLRSITDTTG